MNSKERLDKSLKTIEKLNKMNREELTLSLGYKSKNYLSDLVSSEKPVTDFVLDKLEHKYGLNKNYVKTGVGEMLNKEFEYSNKHNETKETKDVANEITMQAISKLIDSNRLLADSNKVLVDGNMKLIKMVEKATASDREEIPTNVASRLDELLEAVASVVAGKHYKNRDEASLILRKLFYGNKVNEKEGDIQDKENSYDMAK